jgi:enoyl-CoA hydratase
VPERTRDETGFADERRAFARAELTCSSCAPPTNIDVLFARGFVTPLEAEQMRARAASETPITTVNEPTPAHRRAA